MMKMVLGILMMGFLFLTGCASAKAITGPDGTSHQLISCPGIEQCYAKAAEVCGGKYQIVHSSTSGGSDTGSSKDILVKCEKEVVGN